jgi:predicted transcriptional regulator of viral defense system
VYLLRYTIAMQTPERTYDRLVERAGTQHGFVRTEDLDEMEVPQVYVRKLAATGRAEHRARGLYRLTALPVTPNDEYHEAVLWAGDNAAVTGEAALALWDLADVNPRRIELAITPGRRPRRSNNGHFAVVATDLRPEDIDFVDQIPVVEPAAAIAHAIAHGMDGTLVDQAITAAATRGLLTRVREARLRVALDDRRGRAHHREARP